MNIVILINDQHAHDVLGCAGFGELKTPTADRLAADGIRFTQATCATTPCLPSRHNIFHGLHACQTGIYTNGHCMPIDQIPSLTMGKAFKETEYQTAAFGKMHWFPYQAVMERGSYFGFDHRAGHFHETGEVMTTHYIKECRRFAEKRYEERTARSIAKGGDSCAAAFLGYTSELRDDQRPDWWVCRQASSFIDAHKDGPFLLVCSVPGPHAPHEVPCDFAGLYDPGEAPMPPEPPANLPDAHAYDNFKGLSRDDLKTAVANYMAFVSANDACHGLVLDALDRNGLYDDTLIIFLSDHGELLGSRGVTAFSKYNLYERAIRVPLIMKPPEAASSFEGGCTSDSLVSLVDILPTVLDVAGLPVDGALPGISLKPLFESQSLDRERDVAFTEFARGANLHVSIRSRDWKLILGPHGDELYRLGEDPNEFRNLWHDPAYVDKREELEARFIGEMRLVCLRGGNPAQRFEKQDWHPLEM